MHAYQILSSPAPYDSSVPFSRGCCSCCCLCCCYCCCCCCFCWSSFGFTEFRAAACKLSYLCCLYAYPIGAAVAATAAVAAAAVAVVCSAERERQQVLSSRLLSLGFELMMGAAAAEEGGRIIAEVSSQLREGSRTALLEVFDEFCANHLYRGRA